MPNGTGLALRIVDGKACSDGKRYVATRTGRTGVCAALARVFALPRQLSRHVLLEWIIDIRKKKGKTREKCTWKKFVVEKRTEVSCLSPSSFVMKETPRVSCRIRTSKKKKKKSTRKLPVGKAVEWRHPPAGSQKQPAHLPFGEQMLVINNFVSFDIPFLALAQAFTLTLRGLCVCAPLVDTVTRCRQQWGIFRARPRR